MHVLSVELQTLHPGISCLHSLQVDVAATKKYPVLQELHLIELSQVTQFFN